MKQVEINPKVLAEFIEHLKMAIDGCIMNKFKCLIVNCQH